MLGGGETNRKPKSKRRRPTRQSEGRPFDKFGGMVETLRLYDLVQLYMYMYVVETQVETVQQNVLIRFISSIVHACVQP